MKRAVFAALVLFSACSRFLPVDGNGIITTERRALKPATAIAIDGNCNVILKQGKDEYVELNGDSNILPQIKTERTKGICTVKIDNRLHPLADLVITISQKRIDAVKLNGNIKLITSGIIRGKEISITTRTRNDLNLQVSYDEIKIDARDEYYLLLKGECRRLTLDGAGRGQIDTRTLRTDRISLSNKGSITGAGSARKSISLSSFGEIDYAYTGNPKLTKVISGRENIRKVKKF